jgi:hypothetical protein
MTDLVIEHKTQLVDKPAQDMTAFVGNTPLLPLQDLSGLSPGVSIFAKAEWFNPGGSVKDRPRRPGHVGGPCQRQPRANHHLKSPGG